VPSTTPTEIAATWLASGQERSTRFSSMCVKRSESATQAPLMAVVRVPPSACSTSQSTHTVRSVMLPSLTTARSARPIRRWISTERPSTAPARSRDLRVCVELGSIEYSDVSQPWPLPLRKGGTPSV
jgi:hypothetical protein